MQLTKDPEVDGEQDKKSDGKKVTKVDPQAPEFQPRRSSRRSQETAKNRLVGIELNEQEQEYD